MIDKVKFKNYHWQNWIDRPFRAFIISLFENASTKENFAKIGARGVECEAWLFQHGYFYESDVVWDKMSVSLESWLKKDSIFSLSDRLAIFHQESLEILDEINKDKSGNVVKQLEKFIEIIAISITYIWMAHGLERVYKKRLDKTVKKHKIKNLDKFIGDISFPKKKNISSMMTEAVLNKEKAEDIQKKYGWIRVRDGFARPYSISEIEEQMKNTKKPAHHQRPKIPAVMKALVDETQELVFYRTERTDVFYHLLFTARPFLKRLAKHFDLKFSELKNYRAQDLIKNKLREYPEMFTALGVKDKTEYTDKKLIVDEIYKDAEIKGNIAYRGKIIGTAKIVKKVDDLSKVKKGDILVTQMTFPSFITAMSRAVAFVTDEGGITCHAAIVAREMKKPCVIGTKFATEIIKDGDKIEVDANQGIIKKLK